jgi:hypothetical protein
MNYFYSKTAASAITFLWCIPGYAFFILTFSLTATALLSNWFSSAAGQVNPVSIVIGALALICSAIYGLRTLLLRLGCAPISRDVLSHFQIYFRREALLFLRRRTHDSTGVSGLPEDLQVDILSLAHVCNFVSWRQVAKLVKDKNHGCCHGPVFTGISVVLGPPADFSHWAKAASPAAVSIATAKWQEHALDEAVARPAPIATPIARKRL